MRPEDNEETFNLRYQTYLESTTPLIDYYEKKGMLVRISDLDMDSVNKKIVSVIK